MFAAARLPGRNENGPNAQRVPQFRLDAANLNSLRPGDALQGDLTAQIFGSQSHFGRALGTTSTPW